MRMSVEDIYTANQAAHEFRHPKRAMRLTMECGHLKLLPWVACAMGIGASTGCSICPNHPSRLVVNMEETGVLDKTFFEASS